MEEQRRERSRSRRRRDRKSKWGNDDDSATTGEAAPDWVQELYSVPPQPMANPVALRANATGPAAPGAARAGGAGGAASNKPGNISKEMEIPSAVMGHVIGLGGKTISEFRTSTGVHVQVISNPAMPFGKLHIGPGAAESVDKCVRMVNEKLLDYVARGQAQAQATGGALNIPPSLVDEQMQFVPVIGKEIDPAQQLAELQDLGPAYPGGIVKELTIPSNLMGGIIGPRQSTLAQIRKAAQVRVEIASQPKPGVQSEGVLRVGPAPPDIIAKCEELIQIKSEELLGQRPRTNPLTFANIASGQPMPPQAQPRAPNTRSQDVIPPGQECREVEVPKELMGAIIGSQGSGIERVKSALTENGVNMAISISQNPARDSTLPCGKLKLGPALPEQVAKAVQIVEARIEECRVMRESSKGGAPGGGKNMNKGGGAFDPSKGKGKGVGKFGGGKDAGKFGFAAPNPYGSYGMPGMPGMMPGPMPGMGWRRNGDATSNARSSRYGRHASNGRQRSLRLKIIHFQGSQLNQAVPRSCYVVRMNGMDLFPSSWMSEAVDST
ncbi:unnamed protein product [Amoebophrya sp. A25]|nr:unnamed protein product [Amoebophrya sp. A25]|eukprot:GSA25T00026856001.1